VISRQLESLCILCGDLKQESFELVRMQMLSLFVAISTVVAESTPGTETILLVRGGYGPGVNLFSSGSETHRHLGKSKAPVDRTPSEKTEIAKLTNISQTAAILNSQLQTAVKSTYAALQESEQVRVDDANLKERLAVDERKIQQSANAENARAQLETEVKTLQAQLAAEKAKTAAEQKRGMALQAKTASLEKDIKVISRSWKAAAQHQANLAKQAMAELKATNVEAPVVAKRAPATVTKAQVQKRSVKKVVKKAAAVKKAAQKVAMKVEKVMDDDEDSDADDDADDSQDDDDSADDNDLTEDN